MKGHLTKADPDEEGDTVSLKIPNMEIASIFQDTVAKYFSAHVYQDRIGPVGWCPIMDASPPGSFYVNILKMIKMHRTLLYFETKPSG